MARGSLRVRHLAWLASGLALLGAVIVRDGEAIVVLSCWLLLLFLRVRR